MKLFINKHLLILGLATSSVVLTGCVNPDGTANNTGTGILAGGAFGALAGAAIGGRHNGGVDALIGAGAGALAGGLIGNAADQEQNARLQAQAPATYARVNQGVPLTIADVEAMSRAGISSDVIINQIASSHTVFQLSTSDIIELRNAGVADSIVNYMINTPTTAVTVIQQAPPPPPNDPVLVAAPGPDYVWIGGDWVWNGRWVWVGGHWGYPPHPHAVWVVGRRWHDGHGWHEERGHWH